MGLTNSRSRFGSVAKTFHWLMVALILYQFLGATVMLRLGRGDTLLGMNGDFYFNWHKSIGLVLLLLAACRLAWRWLLPLPDWHGSLSAVERRITQGLERWLYLLMFLMPVTGYLYVMAGGFGIELFGRYTLPNPIGKQPVWSTFVRVAHVVLAYTTLVVIAWHVGHVLKKHVVERTGLLNRMLPFR